MCELRESKKPDIKPFDRIILYVDDLDRCRPQQVVQMLEAVHLLLALDLFIVVVAVDSRWLTRALEVHYKELLDVNASTPHNYLEKIFQITYALGPMDPRSFGRYVAALAGADAPRSMEAAPAPATGSAPRSEARSPAPSTVARTTPDTPAPAPPPRASAAEAPRVRIEPAEQALIEQVVSLLPTPRVAKRLVNVYRLIKAGMNAAEREAFAREDRPTSCLVMLAILFGRPGVAGEILRSIQERTPPFDQGDAALADAVRTRASRTADPAHVAAEWKRISANLDALNLKLTIAACAREPLVIARYSLVTGHDWHTWKRYETRGDRASP
ncbi:MAG: hypothetical protein KF773_04740 [Deltaproteobacteria bacterium]|nr:hypothetical protein [Deltaproteobacteria bacterium]